MNFDVVIAHYLGECRAEIATRKLEATITRRQWTIGTDVIASITEVSVVPTNKEDSDAVEEALELEVYMEEWIERCSVEPYGDVMNVFQKIVDAKKNVEDLAGVAKGYLVRSGVDADQIYIAVNYKL